MLYEGAAGAQDVARGVSMPGNAVFRLASMTKPAHTSGIGHAFTDPTLNRALRDSKPREPDSAA